MFKRIDGLAARREVTLIVEGRSITAREGDTLAVALLAAEVRVFRETTVSGAQRAPLCLMGVCFDCMVEVDGAPNVQACMLSVRDGMRVRLQRGAPAAEAAS
jgi:predicted molibdopterin-dependent oxidoreductase YjgC